MGRSVSAYPDHGGPIAPDESYEAALKEPAPRGNMRGNVAFRDLSDKAPEISAPPTMHEIRVRQAWTLLWRALEEIRARHGVEVLRAVEARLRERGGVRS